MKTDTSRKHYRKAVELIPCGTQTRAKNPGIIGNLYPDAPLYFKKAKGCFIWDVDGNKYIDYRAALGPVILGYCHPEVDAAVKKQIDDGIIYSMPGDRELELALEIVDTVPSAEMVRFLKTGSAAVNAAVRLAMAYTGREIILSQGYHGWHDLFMVGKSMGIPRALTGNVREFEYGDMERAAAIMKAEGDKIACIILNPFMGDSIPGREYLSGMKELAEKHGAALIFDEVKTGFRLALGGAQEKYGVIPHLTVLAKSMANGYPISAVAGVKNIMKLLENEAPLPTIVTGTHAGELMSIAASIQTIKILKREGSYQKLYRLGAMLMDGIKEAFEHYEMGGIVRGEPPFFKSCVAGESKDGTPLNSIFINELFKHGISTMGEWLMTLAHDEDAIALSLSSVNAALQKVRELQE